ncbi:hypothetical protein ACU8KH_04678 [Lachancea thermotolerans]
MGSQSSIKSSVSSIKSQNVDRSTPAAAKSIKSGESKDKRATSPPAGWSLWGSRNEGVQQLPSGNQTQGTAGGSAGWWRKPSITSLRTFVKNDPSADQANKDTATVPEESEEAKTCAEPRKRAWSFWNRKSAECDNEQPAEVLNSPGSSTNIAKPVINEIITGVSDDALLYKKRSKDDTAGEQNLESKNEEQGYSSNILTPQFEILPELTTMASIYSSIGKYGHKWNLLSKEKFQPKSLYRIEPSASIASIRANAKEPVRVLLIGVHGFFPTKMIRPLIGEPTGTSTKFITEAEKAVIRWFREQDTPVEISKIALEREGKVLDRVEFFFEVLKKWANEINKADFVYFVAHSQGCPVTIILLARLIEAGVIEVDQNGAQSGKKSGQSQRRKIVSVLAMAGVNNGPFYGVDQTLFVRAYSTIESDSMRELFQFQNFHSLQAKKFIQSLRLIIASNVKVTFVGSINDQLVPLYSSTCLFAHHPNIFKATFIDKDSKTPDFITRIVGIANHLNNLGYDDHGIIKEVSGSLAGTLTGGGHSKIYNEGQVYDLGIKFALQTSELPTPQAVAYKTYQVDELGSNPYHLPWCMRGLLYETGLHIGREQIVDLFHEFDVWEPETKLLKDVKYRLSGLRSKL